MKEIQSSTTLVITSDGSYEKKCKKIWAGFGKKLEEKT